MLLNKYLFLCINLQAFILILRLYFDEISYEIVMDIYQLEAPTVNISLQKVYSKKNILNA